MPGWSPEIANEFIRLAAVNGRAFDQMQLQKLVYIAHGWRLAIAGEPLTGDRPEAWDFGPMYRRLADHLAGYGRRPVTHKILSALAVAGLGGSSGLISGEDRADLDTDERDLIARVYQDYGRFASSQLSALTRDEGSPWSRVYRGGKGRFDDITHTLIRNQFAQISQH